MINEFRSYTSDWHGLSKVLLAATVLVGSALASASEFTNAQPEGGALAPDRFADHFDLASATRLEQAMERGARHVRELGLSNLPPPGIARAAVSGLIWPLAPAPGEGVNWHGISNFVDLNPAFPNQVLDYNCGARTYDNNSGYNHRGTDFFLWPFPWTVMDAGTISAVAAAPGTIIARIDGNFDRECTGANDTPNYLFVQHSDGTVAWYLHLKNGSLTPKGIGASVLAGEYLGLVASSGASTGPHLHFELRASSAGNAEVLDPFQGSCQNSASSWAQQRPYYDSTLIRLATHNLAPAFPNCPATTDTPNFKTAFLPGEQIRFAAYYRDQRRGQVSNFRILRPDGSVFEQFDFDSGGVAGSPDHYAASYWVWTYTLPANAPQGYWSWVSSYQGRTLSHKFAVGDPLFTDRFE